MTFLDSPVSPPGLAALLLAALVWDALLGEPPALLHPVVWMGWAARAWFGQGQTPAGEEHNPASPWVSMLFWRGALGAAVLPLAFGLGGAGGLAWGWAELWRLDGGTLRAAALAGWWVAAVWWLKSALAFRGLGRAVQAVGQALAQNNLPLARQNLSALCSRDATRLGESELAAGAVSSAAENLNDALVAPLFWFGVGGLAGAATFRTVNTLDAMVGYHGRWEFLGKVVARLDDAMNWIPARLTAVLILVSAGERDGRLAWRVWRRDHALTPSPNGGHPMAALAGALGLRLEKPGSYILGADGRHPSGADVAPAWRLTRRAGWLAVLLTLGFLVGLEDRLSVFTGFVPLG
ncbi:MAG: adenosylcobinamide-phosphate synthase CbiB [Deltaproteobacteria bacterium]|nr:adenosylcobinamide-phosphate synthase CbiB [Deltaproteobacteria bacterium]